MKLLSFARAIVLFGSMLLPTLARAQEDSSTGTSSSASEPEDEEERRRRIIKTLQRKNFMKIGRFEASPTVGFVTNDPFIKRYLLGASVSYHLTEVFAIEGVGIWSPDFGDQDRKIITDQLINENKVSPDISKIEGFGNFNFVFSPIYGKIAVSDRKIINFDVFGSFGTGVVKTNDDLEALNAEDDEAALATEHQTHVTTNFGGGFRVIFSKNFAARLEGRSMVYVETIGSETLEMKNNFMLFGSASFFFPGME